MKKILFRFLSVLSVLVGDIGIFLIRLEKDIRKFSFKFGNDKICLENEVCMDASMKSFFNTKKGKELVALAVNPNYIDVIRNSQGYVERDEPKKFPRTYSDVKRDSVKVYDVIPYGLEDKIISIQKQKLPEIEQKVE